MRFHILRESREQLSPELRNMTGGRKFCCSEDPSTNKTTKAVPRAALPTKQQPVESLAPKTTSGDEKVPEGPLSEWPERGHLNNSQKVREILWRASCLEEPTQTPPL